MTRRHAPRDGRRRPDSAGFALLEVVIAMVILALVLVAIGFVLTGQITSIASSRNEEAAQGLLSKALGEVRAMPYADVAHGLSNRDTTATGTTAHILRSGTTWLFSDATLVGHGNGEVILHSTPGATTPSPPAPFYPHRATFAVNGASYTVRAFPTKLRADTPSTPAYILSTSAHPTPTTPTHDVAPGIYRVTVIVTWSVASHGAPNSLVGQTLISPSGSSCLTGTTSPIAAPCKPNFNATADSGGGTVTIRRKDPAIAPIRGLTFTSLELVLPGASSGSSLLQTSSVLGWAQASGAIESTGTTTQSETSKVSTGASDDPASPLGPYQHATLQQTSTAITIVTGNSKDSITATPSSGDTGTSVSTASAKSTQTCDSLSGSAQATSLPCGSGSATQKAQASIRASLWAGDTRLGTTPFVTVTPTPAHPDKSFSARYAGGAPTCSSLTRTSGCVLASAQGGLGSIALADLPSTDAERPPAWGSGLVTISNLSATVYSWSKSGTVGDHAAGSASVPIPGAPKPVLSYWNNATQQYTRITLTGSNATVKIPTFSLTDGPVKTSMSATLTVSQAQAFSVTSTTCRKVCTAGASGSAVTGTITYLVTQGGTIVVDVTLVVDFSTASVSTSYQAAS